METDCVLKLSNKIILIPLNGSFMYFTIMNAIITISVCFWKNNESEINYLGRNDKKEHSNRNNPIWRLKSELSYILSVLLCLQCLLQKRQHPYLKLLCFPH